jgi:endoglycosylceramidase
MMRAMPSPRRLLRGATIAVVLLSVVLAASASAASPPADAKLERAAVPKGPLHTAGRWITDRSGRVVILHGINMVYKRPPYQPAAVGFGADDAAFLARNGFDTVRLGAIENGVEPQPGQYDGGYIRQLRSTERMLARHRVFSLVDFHQDLYNEKFGGEGWPDWAVLDDGLPADPRGFPLTYVTSPGLNRAFDNFWANDAGPGGVGIQDRYAAAWARVARSFRRDRGVLGYDLLNEPWPGTAFRDCRQAAGCPAFDRGTLAPFYRRVTRAIRGVDQEHIAFYEPQVLFNTGANTSIPTPGFGPTGFSFHVYCTPGLVVGAPRDCADNERAVFGNADTHSRQTGDALLLSEYGATDDVAALTRIAQLADRHMVSWQEWHYCGCSDPTTTGPGDIQALVKDPNQPPRGANVFRDKLKALARPYPQAIAGTPLRFSFQPATRRFRLVYTTSVATQEIKRTKGCGHFRHGLTDVFVPRIQYPQGYRATAEGGSLFRAEHGRHLIVRAHPGAKRVVVTLLPAG